METHTAQIVIPNTDADQMFAAYGMGWRISDYRGRLLVSHSGSVQGFHAYLALLPKDKLGIVVLSNLDASSMPQAAAQNITDLILGLRSATGTRKRHARRKIVKPLARRPSWRMSGIDGEIPSHRARWPPTRAPTKNGLWRGDGVSRRRPARAALGLLPRGVGTFNHYDTFDVRGERRLANEQALFSLDGGGHVSGMKFLGMEFRKTPARTEEASRSR